MPKLRKGIARIYCWLFKHDMVEEGKYDNGQSLFGAYECLRCGLKHQWQYDK